MAKGGQASSQPSDRDLAAAVVRTSEDGFVVLDADGVVTFASPGTGQFAGLAPLELVGRSALELIDPEWADAAAIDIAATLAGDDPGGRIAATELRLADGTPVFAELSLHRPEDPRDGALFVQLHAVPGAQLMDEFLEAMVGARQLDDLLRPVMALAITDVRAHGCSIHWNWTADGTFGHHASIGVDSALLDSSRFDTGELPWCAAVAGDEVVVVPSLQTEEGNKFAAEACRAGFGAVWSLPVPGHGDDKAVLSVWRTREGPLTSTALLSVNRTLQMAALAFERHGIEEKLRHAALHDPLTGAPNRLLLDTRLDEMMAASDGGDALLVLDLDGFKALNDEHGHPAGDLVLCAVVERIEQLLRPGDLLARLGGDEFAVVCAGVSDPDQAADIAHRLLVAISRPLDIDGAAVRVGASIGISLSSTDHTADLLVRSADQALIAAKRRGKGTFEVADATLTWTPHAESS